MPSDVDRCKYNSSILNNPAFQKWKQRYERKAHGPFEIDKNERIIFCADKGFLGYIIDIHNLDFIVTKMCGDGKYWVSKIDQFMHEARRGGLRHIKWCTVRDPKAFKKLIPGSEVINQEVHSGQIVYYFDLDYDNWKGGI